MSARWLLQLAVALLFLVATAEGQAQDGWIARYDGPGNSDDVATDVVTDSDGNTYVTGWSVGEDTDDDFATVKYDVLGNELWVTRYDGPGHGRDRGVAIALDGDGNVYVLGLSDDEAAGCRYATVKYDPDGQELWVATHDGPWDSDWQEYPGGLAVDSEGNAHVAGCDISGGDGDYMTVKYDPDGGQLWCATYDGPGPEGWMAGDGATAIALDAEGNAYVTGRSIGSGTGSDCTTIKYGPDGSELWIVTYDGPSGWLHDGGEAIAVGADGHVRVAGYSEDEAEGDYVTITYDTDGNEEWVARYNGPADDWDQPTAIAVDAVGMTYVTGWSVGEGSGEDFATVKYDASGNELWVARHGGPHPDRAYDVAVGGSGSVHVTGAADDCGDSPTGVAAGDFDGDGDVDLVVSNSQAQTVAVLLGNGDGTFQSFVGYPAGGGAAAVATKDLDDDGSLDLVVANGYGGDVSVLLGNGDGTFQPSVIYSTGGGAAAVVAEDLDGDGDSDLAVTDHWNDSVAVLLGNGDGTFMSPAGYGVGNGPSRLAAEDFDSDGDLDLATANGESDDVSVLLGNGDGTFQSFVSYPAGWGATSVATGDLDGDGAPDLVVANWWGYDVSVLLGNGDGTFQPCVSYPGANYPNCIATGDVDGDGDDDVVMGNYWAYSLSVFLGNGDGTLNPRVDYPAGGDPTEVATGDFDGDGDVDVAVANQGTDNVSVLVGNGDGTFLPFVSYATASLRDFLTVTYDEYGNELWTARYDGPGHDLDTASAIALNADGTMCVTGASGGDGTGSDYATLRYGRDLDIHVSDSLLSFGAVFIGGASTDAIVVSNTGMGQLVVSEISSSHGDYSAAPTSLILDAFESREVAVEFAPSSEGPVPATLTILSNDPDEPTLEIALEGEGLVPPQIEVSPDSLFVDVMTGETPTEYLTIGNTGGSDLVWEIESSPASRLSVGWLSIDPESGVVPAGESTVVAVTFDPGGLYGGDYFADLAILSNDPDDGEYHVSAHMHVTGVPDIAASDTLMALGQVFIGWSATDTLVVVNEGTAVLTVTDISADNADFSPDPTTFTLPPEGSQTVIVEFAPSIEGPIAGTLTILSDDPDEGTLEVALAGEGLIAPEVSVSPDSLYAELLTGETETHYVTIDNGGGSDLMWAMDFRVASAGSRERRDHASFEAPAALADPPGAPARAERYEDLTGAQVLWDRSHGQDVSDDWSVIIADLTSRGATVTENVDPISLVTLTGIDMLWSVEGTQFWTPGEVGALIQWINAGGGLLIEAEGHLAVYAANDLLSALDVGIAYSHWGGSDGNTTNIFPHETTQGVEVIYLNVSACLSDVTPPASILIEDVNGDANTAFSESPGRLIAMADRLSHDSSIGGADNRRFANQVFDWLIGGASWLSAKPNCGTLQAGASIEVAVTFDAADLPEGDHLADLLVLSNDPAEPEASTPAVLHVTGVPDIAVASPLVFDGCLIGATEAETLVVWNEGTGPLIVSDIATNNTDYSVDPTPFEVGPWETHDVVVEFSPSTVGPITGTLTIRSNDPDEGLLEIALEGVGLTPPEIEIDPESLYAELVYGDTVAQTLTVQNLGWTDLEWSVGAIQAVEPEGPARGSSGRNRQAASAGGVQDSGSWPGDQIARGDPWFADLEGVQILWDRSHGGDPGEHETVFGLLAERGATVTESFDPLTGELLAGYDILWSGSCAELWTSAETTAVGEWTASGGALLLQGDSDFAAFSYNGVLGMLDAGIEYSCSCGADGFTTNIYPHEVTREMYRVLLWNNNAQLSTVGPPASRLIDDSEGAPNSACVEIGLGRIVATADQLFDDFRIHWGDHDRLAGQAFGWLTRAVTWLTLDPASGTIPPVQLTEVTATFDSAYLQDGDYFANVTFLSNDPAHPSVTVPMHLSVTGAPDIAVSSCLVACGEVPVGTAVAETLLVSNEGSGQLAVSDISTSCEEFSAEPAAFTLEPGTDQPVVIGFIPSCEGPIIGTLTIVSNDPDEGALAIALEGSGGGVTAVEGSFYADLTESGTVMLRWTVASFAGIDGFHVHRATAPEGPFDRVNEEVIPPSLPCAFEDTDVWPGTTFWYELRAVLSDGTEDTVAGSPRSVTTDGRLVAALYPARPNPFTGQTTMQLDVPNHAGPVRLHVYNVRGQLVRRLIDGPVDPGRREIVWNGTDERGRRTSAGVYLVRLEVGGVTKTQKIAVVR